MTHIFKDGMPWLIERDAGRHAWRRVWSGADESEARAEYDRRLGREKPGVYLRLLRPDGRTEYITGTKE